MRSVYMSKDNGIWMVSIRYSDGRSTHSDHATFADALKAALDAANKCKEE
mgnify:CR=1 FL=1